MSEPGERLRAERERRGFSTQKVAEDLHVDAWVVEALEAGRHASLGAPVYVKGHLRKYAALLGLDGEELVAAACPEQSDPPLVVFKAQARTGARRRVSWKPLLAGAAVLALLAAGVWGYRWWSQRSGPAQTTTNALQPEQGAMPAHGQPGTSADVSPVADARGAKQAPGATKLSATAPAAANAPPATAGVPAPPMIRLRLNFSADSWVELYDANKRRVFFDLGVANSARSFTVAAPARVFLGYADAVQVELDGRPVTLTDEVRRDNVAHFTIDARGRLKPAGSLTGR